MMNFLNEFEGIVVEPEKRFIVKRSIRKGYRLFIVDKLRLVKPHYSNISDEEVNKIKKELRKIEW